MKISDHADHTEKLFGIRGEDIHRWIDGFFEHDGLDHSPRPGKMPKHDPYDHRKFRHCQEALEEAYRQFASIYTKEDIKNIFETHIKDDYGGYIPTRKDFENGMFTQKYHESLHQDDWNTILDNKELSEYFKGVKAYDEYRRPDHFVSSFGLRIVVPTVLAVILFITSIYLVVLPVVKNSMMSQKKNLIKELTATAVSIADLYILQNKVGILSKEDAKKLAAKKIQAMRYGEQNKDYFFITDMTPRMVMHPYRLELIGQDLTNYTDDENKSGKHLFVEFVKLVEQYDEGYLEYLWQWQDDKETSVPKLSYVKGVPEWNWVIGTGIYINDVKEEIRRLKRDLYFTFSGITLGLALILGYIIYQSHNIENRKKRAEILLHDAKDRYRALVESSNEGYMLEADGEILYTNNTLKKIVGYSDEVLRNPAIVRSLFPQRPINGPVLEHFTKLFQAGVEPAEFEAEMMTKSGKVIDIIISTSKIFLLEKKGHVISFRPITRKVYGGANPLQKDGSIYGAIKSEVSIQIAKSDSTGGVVTALNQLPELIRTMIDNGTKPDNLRRVIGEAYDAAITRFIDLSIEELGEPPVGFSFISMGSNARHDMTLFSDQDNGLIFEDCSQVDLEATRRYFLHLAERVCSQLDKAGYSYCEGLIMASNPQWCLSLSEWKKNFSEWIIHSTADSILEFNVFFDLRSTYGDNGLVGELHEHIFETTRNNEQFFINYAENCLSYDQPLHKSGRIKTEKQAGVKTVNLKECLRPMEIFCRIYALKYDIREANTVARLKKLAWWGDISSKEYLEMIYIFDHIWHLRFMNQIAEYTELRKVNDSLILEDLTDIEQQNLKNVLAKVSIFHDKVKKDFLSNA